MGAFLGLLGFAGIVLGIILFIKSKRKKTSVKLPVICLVISMVLFFAGLGTPSNSSKVATSADITSTTTVTTTAVTTKVTTVAQTQTTHKTTENTTVGTTKAESTTARALQDMEVYIPKSGKKYHYNKSCSNGEYTPVKKSKAVNMGYNPCSKCA